MSDTSVTDLKALHALIDELIVYIGVLKKSPRDTTIVDLFDRRFFRSGQLLYTYGHTELSELARDIHEVFNRVFNQSLYVTNEILQITLSFLALARKAIMFSDAPDFQEITQGMILELRNSLHQFRDNKTVE
jgi:hypothetical protein